MKILTIYGPSSRSKLVCLTFFDGIQNLHRFPMESLVPIQTEEFKLKKINKPEVS